jgi:RNA polymerase sigma-70 factor, ECF subfamily
MEATNALLAGIGAVDAASGDAQLVRRLREHDEEAVRLVIKRYNQRLFRVARAVLRDDGEAEDVVQETYVRAFANLSLFRGEALFSTWLTRIALNEALGRMRRRRAGAGLESFDEAGSQSGGRVIMFPSSGQPDDPEKELARSQVRRVLEQAVDELPEIFRVVFVLRDIEGMSAQETATHLSIKAETVKTRLHRARRLIRAIVERQLSPIFTDLFPFDGARCSSMADRVVARLRSDKGPDRPDR